MKSQALQASRNATSVLFNFQFRTTESPSFLADVFIKCLVFASCLILNLESQRFKRLWWQTRKVKCFAFKSSFKVNLIVRRPEHAQFDKVLDVEH